MATFPSRDADSLRTVMAMTVDGLRVAGTVDAAGQSRGASFGHHEPLTLSGCSTMG